MKKNLTQIWLQKQVKNILLHWKEYLIIFKNNFILIPSAMLIFAYLFGYLNELNKETIEYYFLPLGISSLIINTTFNHFPYMSKGIKDIRDEQDTKESYIYSLKLRFEEYIIKEKEDYISINKYDSTYFECIKNNLKDASIYTDCTYDDVFYIISDAMHNIGNKFFKNSYRNYNPNDEEYFDINDKEYMENIGRLLCTTRRLAYKLRERDYSKEEYKNIVDFLKNDFYDYCHYKTKFLDLDKYRKLIWQRRG